MTDSRTLHECERTTQPLSSLLPDPYASFEQWERLAFQDVDRLLADAVWAERKLLEFELARRIFTHVREQFIAAAEMTDREWIRERLRRLDRRAVELKGRAA